MTEDYLSREPGEIVYHFDVDQGSIPLAQFIDTARATQEIIDDFNKSLFDSKLKYELRVKSPENGSLIEVLKVVVTVGGSILAFLSTDIGKAFFKGLTMEAPAAWAEKVGAAIRQKIPKSKAAVATDDSKALVEVIEPVPVILLAADISKKIEGEVVALILTNFLKIDSGLLEEIGITPEKFRAAFQGRNRVFKGCIDNPEVKGITFDRSDDFSIKRSDFPKRIIQLPDPLLI